MSYANDLDGNTLTGGGRTNTWDSQNRLVTCVNGANSSSFVYGAVGLRRQSTVNGTTTDFVLDNSMFVRERGHSTGNNIATFLVGARGPEYRRDDVSGAVRWYLYDGLGSVLGEIDPNGTITSSRKYDVYGAVRGGINPAGSSKHKFVGQLGHPSEDETGLIYMRARYYDPTAGRFICEDTSKQGLNWLLYCGDNPVNAIDQDGKSWRGVLVFFGIIEALTCFSLLLLGAMMASCVTVKVNFCYIAAGGVALLAANSFAFSTAGLTRTAANLMVQGVDFVAEILAFVGQVGELMEKSWAMPFMLPLVAAVFIDGLIAYTVIDSIGKD